jgi:FKBP-type peptidyl-prolyl cis-trans isomerase FkpA|tara:strand:- start:1217 stop:1738 length:522 start_codon:yes stop_codon:yes gene_type:complete
MKNQLIVAIIITFFTLTACNTAENNDVAEDEAMTNEETTNETTTAECAVADESGLIQVAPGLSARVVKKGFGRSAVAGDYADTNVWLWLYDESAEDKHGAFIWESGSTVFQFQLGAGQVIKGWDLGVPCMLEGETRELIVDGDLAYGPSGRGEIPPNATLIFTIELLKLTAPD